jgi:O-antigen ligase
MGISRLNYRLMDIQKNRMTLWENICYSMAVIILGLLPFYNRIIPPFIVFWVLSYLIYIYLTWKSEYIKGAYKILFSLFMLFFLWQLIGLLYTEHLSEGWRNIELRLSLLLFPLLLISPVLKIRRNAKHLLKVFAISNFTYLIICYCFALYRSVQIENGNIIFNPYLPNYTWLNFFYSTELSFFLHPSYIAMFTLMSLFISLENFFSSIEQKRARYIWIIVILTLFISIYYLSSRASILATMVSLPIYFILKFKTHKYRKFIWFIIGGIILIIIPIALTNPRVNKYLLWRSERKLENKETGREDRWIIWNSALKIIKNNLIFGVGTGDIQIELNNEYKRIGNINLAHFNTNAHNQFLEVFIENGLIGLILLLCIFGICFCISITDKNLLYLIFVVVISVSFLFETMLNRFAGVAFFSIFSFLLLYNEDSYI